ncbi:MAG TPA: hypothetical protein PK878_04475 [bacterium]|mgnify:CR=1 FL=1|nr:hypothetical protein [bacterium]HOL96689.1 hypothetical protein [bacterium]HPP01286.1 hypothetical protein [bacterium]HXK93284.1 hypothetical protein [bacterium]
MSSIRNRKITTPVSESDIIDRRISDIQNIFTERFKQSIINEYLKENPGVRRDEVIERIHNGQVVIDTIDNVFQEISRRERITESFKDKKLYELLQIEQDDRYKACLASIRNSERIIQYLFTSNYAPFGLAEKNQALNYLTHKERVCANWTANYYKATKDIFTLMMSHYTVPAAKVQGLISLYFTALHQQLLCQREIYMKELELIELFSRFSKTFVQTNAKIIQSKIKSSPKKDLVVGMLKKACLVMNKNYSLNLPIKDKYEIDQFISDLNQVDSSLSQKREEVEFLGKAITVLEKVVGYIEQYKTQKIQSPPPSVPPSAPETKPASRMVFLSRMKTLFGRFRRVRG